jgi:hypothetical protein
VGDGDDIRWKEWTWQWVRPELVMEREKSVEYGVWSIDE